MLLASGRSRAGKGSGVQIPNTTASQRHRHMSTLAEPHPLPRLTVPPVGAAVTGAAVTGAAVEPGAEVLPGAEVVPRAEVVPGVGVLPGAEVLPGAGVLPGAEVVPGVPDGPAQQAADVNQFQAVAETRDAMQPAHSTARCTA